MRLTVEPYLISRNFAAGRNDSKISEITIHHAAGTGHLQIMFELFEAFGRNGSAHYAVRGQDVAQFVLEKDTAWANSNRESNQRAITIEVVNSSGQPDWPVSLTTYETLISLVFDIAKRNNLLPLVKGKSLTWHSMYSATICPGPWLLDHLDHLVARVNELDETSRTLVDLIEPNLAPEYRFNQIYRVRNNHGDARSQQGAFNNYGKAQLLCDLLNEDCHRWAVYNQDGKRLYPKGKP